MLRGPFGPSIERKDSIPEAQGLARSVLCHSASPVPMGKGLACAISVSLILISRAVLPLPRSNLCIARIRSNGQDEYVSSVCLRCPHRLEIARGYFALYDIQTVKNIWKRSWEKTRGTLRAPTFRFVSVLSTRRAKGWIQGYESKGLIRWRITIRVRLQQIIVCFTPSLREGQLPKCLWACYSDVALRTVWPPVSDQALRTFG